jgi:hypothetical protein
MAVFYNTERLAPLYLRKMKMRTIRAAMLFAIGLTAAGDKADFTQLAWLAGCWEGQTGPVRIEEQWSKPAGGTMLGLSRNMKGDKVIFSEFMRIDQDEGKIVYMARIGTRATPTPFGLIRMSADEAVFENLAHPFPQRIRFRREANGSLFARIEGMDKGKARSEDYPMQRARCER